MFHPKVFPNVGPASPGPHGARQLDSRAPDPDDRCVQREIRWIAHFPLGQALESRRWCEDCSGSTRSGLSPTARDHIATIASSDMALAAGDPALAATRSAVKVSRCALDSMPAATTGIRRHSAMSMAAMADAFAASGRSTMPPSRLSVLTGCGAGSGWAESPAPYVERQPQARCLREAGRSRRPHGAWRT